MILCHQFVIPFIYQLLSFCPFYYFLFYLFIFLPPLNILRGISLVNISFHFDQLCFMNLLPNVDTFSFPMQVLGSSHMRIKLNNTKIYLKVSLKRGCSFAQSLLLNTCYVLGVPGTENTPVIQMFSVSFWGHCLSTNLFLLSLLFP